MTVVVHYKELALKGKNRPWFVKLLVRNLRTALAGLDVKSIKFVQGRIEIELGDAARADASARLREDASARQPVADFIASLQALDEVKETAWDVDGARLAGAHLRVGAADSRDLAQAVAIVAKAAFDEQRESPRMMKIAAGDDLIVLAGSEAALPSLPSGPDEPNARAMDFVKGGKGLKLIWAAFVLEKHGVQAWADTQHRASVAVRIPLVQA